MIIARVVGDQIEIIATSTQHPVVAAATIQHVIAFVGIEIVGSLQTNKPIRAAATMEMVGMNGTVLELRPRAGHGVKDSADRVGLINAGLLECRQHLRSDLTHAPHGLDHLHQQPPVAANP